ncbi:hypothetical protein B566_EDAN001808 [Ephemera danica]|nr:hypothetical protein B566_EDAN001808 [Ephemera danica]
MREYDGECEAAAYGAQFVLADYVVCVLTLFISAAIGVYCAWQARKQKASTSNVLMGGRTMGTFPTAMSLFTSFMSAIALLGYPTEIYKHGTQYFAIVFSYIILIPITAYFFIPVYHNLRLTSAYEYLALRFNNAVRLIGSIIFMMMMILYMPIVVYAPALALSQVSGIDKYVAVTLTFFVCIFYTSIGGMKAVMWTDAFQAFLMMGGTLAVVVRGTFDVGGTQLVWERAQQSGRLEFFNLDADPTTRHTFWTMVVGGTFVWGSNYAANQAQIQRYLSVPTVRQARNALWLNCVGLIVLLALLCWAGLVMYAKYAFCDPLRSKQIQAADQLMLLFVMETMHDLPGIPGLFVAGVFSGSLSTVSTGLSSLAAIAITDLFPGICGIKLEDERAAGLVKWISLLFGLLCFALVFVVAQLGAILQVALSVFGMVGGPMFGLFSLGMLVPWANKKGALAGVISSLVIVLWIGLGAQVEAISGRLRFEQRVTSVEACHCNTTLGPPLPPDPDAVSVWYAISYMWYGPIAWLVLMVVGIGVSLVTNPQDPRNLDRGLISPVVVKILNSLPLEWQHRLHWIDLECSGASANSNQMDLKVITGQENKAFQRTDD